MKTKLPNTLIIAAGALALLVTSAYAQERTPGFNQKIPEKIMKSGGAITDMNFNGPALGATFGW